MTDTQKPETITPPIVQDKKPDFEHPRGQEWMRGKTEDGKTCWS